MLSHRRCKCSVNLAWRKIYSFYPDNEPVAWEQIPDGVILCQATDLWNNFTKMLCIRFLTDGRIEVTHILKNSGKKEMMISLWGITTLCGGGSAEIPFTSKASTVEEYQPRRVIVLWGNASLADERLIFNQDSIEVHHLLKKSSMKFGLCSSVGKMSAMNFGQKLTISFQPLLPEQCSDLGCNSEIFLNHDIMELETLGPKTLLEPGKSIEHREYWYVESILG